MSVTRTVAHQDYAMTWPSRGPDVEFLATPVPQVSRRSSSSSRFSDTDPRPDTQPADTQSPVRDTRVQMNRLVGASGQLSPQLEALLNSRDAHAESFGLCGALSMGVMGGALINAMIYPLTLLTVTSTDPNASFGASVLKTEAITGGAGAGMGLCASVLALGFDATRKGSLAEDNRAIAAELIASKNRFGYLTPEEHVIAADTAKSLMNPAQSEGGPENLFQVAQSAWAKLVGRNAQLVRERQLVNQRAGAALLQEIDTSHMRSRRMGGVAGR